MTAHREKSTITSARIEWFAAYLNSHAAWGVFHVCLDDGNWKCGAADWDPDTRSRAEWREDVREAADWFDSLTPSQRQRLERKARALAREKPLLGLRVTVHGATE